MKDAPVPELAIIGAGVSGLTCGVLLAERGYRVTIFAEELGERTTSAAAAAILAAYCLGAPPAISSSIVASPESFAYSITAARLHWTSTTSVRPRESVSSSSRTVWGTPLSSTTN